MKIKLSGTRYEIESFLNGLFSKKKVAFIITKHSSVNEDEFSVFVEDLSGVQYEDIPMSFFSKSKEDPDSFLFDIDPEEYEVLTDSEEHAFEIIEGYGYLNEFGRYIPYPDDPD